MQRPDLGAFAHGYHLVLEHVAECLATTGAVEGRILLTPSGLEVHPA